MTRDHEINKGCFAHELDLDGQARMMSTEPATVDIGRTRRASGLSQCALARRAGVSAMTVSLCERGLRGVSEATRERVVRALRG